MRRLSGFFAALWMACAGAVAAQDNPVVVELFTSQGCSSCPPADALLGKLAQRPDVIALALHVDYWDYIGWKDVFASPEFTKRQKDYARSGGRRMVYTPQMVIGGTDHVVGNHPMDVSDMIRVHAGQAPDVQVKLTKAGSKLSIQAEPVGRSVGNAVVQLVRYKPSQSVAIKRGENKGHTIRYHNIVTELTEIGRWNGRGSLSMTASLRGSDPAVVIIQSVGHGPILAAARLR